MQVDDRRSADPLALGIDAANQPVDVVSELPVEIYSLARGNGQLEEHGFVRVDLSLGDQLPEGLDSLHDPLRIVQAIDAEEHHPRVTKIMPDILCTLGGLVAGRQLVETLRVDCNRIRPGEHLAAVRHPNPIPQGLQTESLHGRAEQSSEPHQAAGTPPDPRRVALREFAAATGVGR